jgi:hypothetical protein
MFVIFFKIKAVPHRYSFCIASIYIVGPAKPLQPALMLVVWGESRWSELSKRYSIEPVFWEFLKAAP